MVLESNTLDVLFVKDGQQGEDGKILYTWIKYAKDANGTGITDDPNGAIYIGISYNNESSIESNDPTHYAWTKIQGADGKKGEDAYTIFLENENISFATDKNRNPLSEQAYTSGITIMKGAKPVTDFTIGDIAKTQGIAVAKTDTAIAISVVNGNSLPNDSGEIEIPITVDGTVFKKILTWTCAKKGDQGEKGEQGIQGPQGEQGIAGKDGTSVTITNKSITYQLSTSGTTIPTGTWQTSPQTIPEGQYQWTKTSVTYSDGNKTESYSISYHGKNGSNGTSVKTTSTSVKYQVGDSGTTKPTGTWQANVPTVVQGKYLWTQTIVNYSDGNSTESYSVAYRGIDGNNGVNGMNAATIYLYQRATSTPNKPSNTLTYTFSTTKITGTLNNGWSTAIPTGTDAVYVTVASVSSKNDTATIATSAWSAPVVLAQNGKTGSDGKAGLNVATIYLYQRNTSKPSKPSASVTYTFSTGVASGLNNGWSQKIPDGTNPLYVTLATASSNTATDTILSSEWSDVVVMAQNGEDGISPKVSLSKSGNTTTISIIDATGTHTQTVKDGTNGTPGAAGKDGKTSYFHVKYSNDGGKTFTSNSGEDTGIYMGSYTDYTETDSTDVKKYNWVKVKGDKGDTGQKGQNAKNLSITPSSQYFKSTDGGKTFAPNTITIKPTIQGEISFGKWQYSIDGGVSFADIVSGQKGLTINNNVLTVSKDSSLYSDGVTMVTFRAVANDSNFYDTCSIAKIYDVSDIGDGRNLLRNSNFAKTDEAITGTTNSWGLHTRGTNLVASIDTSTKHNGFNTLKTVSAANGDKNSSNDLEWFAWGISERTSDNLHSKNQNYTLSFYAKASVTTDFIVRWGYDAYGADTTRTLTTNWQKYEIKLHQATSAYSITVIFKLLTAGTVWFSEFKLEKGSSATGYSTAPEDLQTAILSTKSEISDVSLKVDNNKQAIEQRVEKTTYQQDLKLVKGDISKANEGLNKWRYEIYPKSLFTSEYQGKSTMDVFAKNTNLTPSQSVLINDTDFGKNWAYGDNYIGYALTFVKFSAAKSVAITFKHDDGAHLYLNGKLIGGDDTCNTGSGESLTLSFIQGWNCLEVVLNEKSGGEYIGLGTTISAISECQLMNCYYGTPVARQSHITNQLVQNTTDIDGVSTKVSKVTSVIGDNGENFTSFKNDYSDFKQTMNGFKTTVGQTYVTKDDFNGLEIGGRNLVRLGGLSSNGATSFSYDKTTDIYTIVSPVVSTVWGIGAAVKYDDNHKVLIPYGKTYILSFEVKVPQALSINIDINNFAVSGSSWAGNDNDDGSMRGQSSYNIPANTWTKVWVRWANTNTKNTNKVDLYDNSSIGLVTKDCTSAITWQIRHVKGELGNKPTDWTPAPEDVNGKIVNVETIANQTAKKFEWIVKGGDSSSNFTLTDRVADLVAERINFKGLVTFSGLNTDAKNEIGKVAQSKVDGLEIGGRNLIINSNLSRTLTNVTNDGCSNMTVVSDSVYGHALKFTAVNQRRVFWATSNVWVKNKTYTVSFVAKSSVTGQKIRPSKSTADWGDDITLTTSYARYTTKITSLDTNAGGTLSFSCTNAVGDITITNVKLEVGNKATDWTPAPEDVSQDATNKASQALTDAKNYSSNAVNWVTNNGSSTTSLNSMVKKWTDGAVSDTAHINGGWIKANTITASKIALADFTNYSQLTRDTADAYGFTVTDDTDGTWFSTKNIKRDQFISEIFPCNGGESYLIEYDISTNAKGANNSTDTKNYIGVAIGVYGYTGTVGSNGLPNKATNIWYADRITGSETAPSIHVKTTITTSTATKQFRVFLQSNGYYFEGTTKIRNLSVRRMYGGTLIVDGSITADKIATDAIKSRNYISSGGTQGSFLNLSDGSFQSPNLSWDSNGNLIAKNANLSGQINATKGTVGGWNIATNGLYSGIDENAIKIYSATTYDAQTMYQKQKIQDSFILSQKYINHFVSQQVSVGHNIPYWQTRSFIYNDSQIQLAQSDYCINTSSASNYDAQYSLKDGYISATRIYMEQNITQVGGDVINSSFSIGLDSMMGWCSIQSTKGINIYGNSSRALYVQSNDTSKYNALETEGDVVVNGKIHAVSGDNKIQLNSDNNGSIELYGNTPFIDFHSAYSSADYTCRIIANTPEQLLVCGKLRCDSNIISNNDLIANSWVYAGQNAHYTWQNQLDCYFSCGYYNNTNNVYYYAGYHAFYVNNDSGSGMMYINTNGVTSRVGFTKTSDERIKKNFESFDDNIIDAYMNIEPVKYQLKQSSNDNYHFGFKAQHVDKVFSDYGDTYNESFDICTSRPIDPDKAKELYGVDDMTEEYGLRYDELIAPTTYMVQHIYKELESTKGELAKVKQEKADLETRLQAIEAKLRL